MKLSALIPALAIVGATTVVHTQQPVPFAGERHVRVMTRNVYHGVNTQIFDVPNATSVADLLNKVAAVYTGYLASNFQERAMALAAEIEATRPDLVGVQEAVLVRTQFPADGAATPATAVALDYLQILMGALAARGLTYEVVVQRDGLDVELPSAFGFDVRHTDRVAILARTDLSTADLKVSNARAGNFLVNCEIPSALLGAVTVRRGWVAADAKIRGATFRVVNTHLDGDCLPFTAAIQRAQANELLAGPANTDLPLLLIGDLNSPSDGSGLTYNDLLEVGFIDAWTTAGAGVGLTCCQASDLLNPVSLLQTRIDLVLFRGPFSPLAAIVVGDDPAVQTPSGLWPSDHAGVVAALNLTTRSGR